MELNLVVEKDCINFQDINEVQLASLQYEETEANLIVNSINVKTILRGMGIAGKLMEEIDRISMLKDKSIIPICSYAVKWIEENK